MSRISLLFVLSLCATYCHQEKRCGFDYPSVNANEIVFGVSYAECGGDCSQNFWLTPTQLFADTCHYCFPPNIGFQATPLPDSTFQTVQALLSVPDDLLEIPNTVFGCPGCADEGGYYLRITANGVTHTYQWSAFMTNVPAEAEDYFGQVMQTLQAL